MANPRVVVDYIANTQAMQAGAAQVGGAGAKAGAALHKAMAPAAIALGAIGVGMGKATQAASSLNEQMAASTQVFGKHAKGVQAWAATGAKAFGLSSTEALSAANAYGNMFSAVGLGAGETAKMSESMVQLAGDMASFHDQDPSEMLDKLRSGLSGEAEPLRKFGILMSDASIKTFAYQHGIAKAGSELTEAQKVQARYGFILANTTKQQGDFARTGDSVANQQRTMAANTENTAAALGQSLLPVMQALLTIFNKALGVFKGHSGALTVLIAAVAALSAGIIVVNAGMAVWTTLSTIARTVIAGQTVAQWALNAATAAFPVLLIVAGLAAMVAGLVLAYKHSETFRKIVDAAFDAVLSVAQALFNWLRGNWPLLVAIIGGPIVAAAVLIARNWDTIRSVTTSAWGAVRSAVASVVDWIRGALSSLGSWISGWVHGALATATGKAGDAFDKIEAGAKAAVAAVRTAMSGIEHAIASAVGAIGNAAQRVANAIKSPINAFIASWNSTSITIPTIKIPAVKVGKHKIGGQTVGGGSVSFPSIKPLATGGVVSDPTLALVGEGIGREIVAPEALLREIVGERGGPSVRVFIGDTELRGIVRTEVVDATTGVARTLIANRA